MTASAAEANPQAGDPASGAKAETLAAFARASDARDLRDFPANAAATATGNGLLAPSAPRSVRRRLPMVQGEASMV